MDQLTRKDIVDSLVPRVDLKRDEIDRIVCMALDTLAGALANARDVDIRGLGTFRFAVHNATKKTLFGGKVIEVPPKIVVKFQPAAFITDKLNEGRFDSASS